jgi:hypothetical protein
VPPKEENGLLCTIKDMKVLIFNPPMIRRKAKAEENDGVQQQPLSRKLK